MEFFESFVPIYKVLQNTIMFILRYPKKCHKRVVWFNKLLKPISLAWVIYNCSGTSYDLTNHIAYDNQGRSDEI